MSNSLRPHGLQHPRLPCPVSPGDSRPLAQWCYDYSSHPLLPSSPFVFRLAQHQGLFQWVGSVSSGQSIGASVSASVLPMNIQGWFPLGWTGWISLQSKGLSRVFSNTVVWNHQFFGAQPSSSPSLTFVCATGKAIALTMQTFVGKVMSLLFNTLSKFVNSFSFKEQVSFNFMAAVNVRSDFGAQENKICHCFHYPPSICHEVMGLDALILVFWMLTFKPAFSLSSFTLIKRLFSSSSLSAIWVVSSPYLRFLIFLLTIQ